MDQRKRPVPDHWLLRHPSFKALHAVMLGLDLPFSEEGNAQYGVLHATLIFAAMWLYGGASFEEATRTLRNDGLRVPGADWILRILQKMDVDDIEARFIKLLRRGVSTTGEVLWMSMDGTSRPRHDRNFVRKMLTRGLSRSGTRNFEKYLTANLAAGLQLTLSVHRVRRGDALHEDVAKLLKGIRRTLGASKKIIMLADREFANVRVLLTLERMRFQYVMPVERFPGIKKAITEYQCGRRQAVSKHSMTSWRHDKGTADYTLVIVEGKNGPIPFVTSLDVDAGELASTIPEEYRKRWGIETGYRTVKQALPRTTSTSESVRVFLMYMTFLMRNQLILVCDKKIGKRVTRSEFIHAAYCEARRRVEALEERVRRKRTARRARREQAVQLAQMMPMTAGIPPNPG